MTRTHRTIRTLIAGGIAALGLLTTAGAAQAAPDDAQVHAIRAEIFQKRRDGETSLMAKGIFGYAANESKARLGD